MLEYWQEFFFGPTAAAVQLFLTVVGALALLALLLRALFRPGGWLNR